LSGALAGLCLFAAQVSGAREAAIVVAAHPDDLISCAGAAAILAQHYELHLVDTKPGRPALTVR